MQETGTGEAPPQQGAQQVDRRMDGRGRRRQEAGQGPWCHQGGEGRSFHQSWLIALPPKKGPKQTQQNSNTHQFKCTRYTCIFLGFAGISVFLVLEIFHNQSCIFSLQTYAEGKEKDRK